MNRSISSRIFPLIFLLLSVTSLSAQLGKLDSLYYGNMGLGAACLGGFVQPDSSVIIFGQFGNCNERVTPCIAKIKQDGSNDYTFNIGSGAGPNGYYVTCVTRQSDGKLLVGGSFSSFNGTTPKGIIRLNTNVSTDTSFHSGTGFNSAIPPYAIYVQPSGSIVLAGSFAGYNGVSSPGIVRLLSNGTRDTSFHCGTGPNAGVTSMIAQPNGQILVGGNFTKYNGVTDSGIALLNSDGSLDTTFSLQRGPGAGKAIYSLALKPGGKIMVGGSFTAWAGRTENYIARLNSNGTLDTTFSTGTGFNNYVYSIIVQPNNQLVLGGGFTIYKGSSANYVNRMDAVGDSDGTFSVSTGPDGALNSVFLNYDGKVFASGSFSTVDSFALHNLVRLQSTVGIDQTFFYNSKLNYAANTVVTQSTGKVILGGYLRNTMT